MKCNTEQGFTLVEVMITVAVIAILAAIAIPAYGEYIKRGARDEAKAALLEDALLMEQQFTLNNTYGTVTPPGFVLQSPKTGTAKYTLSLDPAKLMATSYVLWAVPAKTDKCGTFTLDNTGLRGVTGTASVVECWGA
jgi:type IV pilus assembly protein PilE